MAGRITIPVEIVGGRGTGTGTERVHGVLRIDVDDPAMAQQIAHLYAQTNLAVFRLLEGPRDA